MSNMVSGTTHNPNTGFYEVTVIGANGEVTSESLTFSELCVMFSLSSLNVQEDVFAKQMSESQQQIEQLTMINDCMAMLNSYSMSDDGTLRYLDGVTCRVKEGTTVYGSMSNTSDCKSLSFVNGSGENVTVYYEEGSDADKWHNIYQPGLVQTGLVVDGSGGLQNGVGLDCAFAGDDLPNLMQNLETAQATASSQNEQHMLVTNDAASKRSSVLQMAQSLMQQAAEGRKAASQS